MYRVIEAHMVASRELCGIGIVEEQMVAFISEEFRGISRISSFMVSYTKPSKFFSRRRRELTFSTVSNRRLGFSGKKTFSWASARKCQTGSLDPLPGSFFFLTI